MHCSSCGDVGCHLCSSDHKLNFKTLDNPLIVGCSYHTKWQKEKSMRFVLVEIREDKARLITRTTKKDFWTSTKDLIFIKTTHNMLKADRLYKQLHNK